jgi:hypothetical protein
MYTDYDAEKYFLQSSRAMPRCIENAGENAPVITRGPAETSRMQLAMRGPSDSAANSLTPNPKTPANHGDTQ